MVWIEAPAFLRKQPDQQLPAPVMTAPVFDSTPTSNAAGRDASAAECHRIYESQH